MRLAPPPSWDRAGRGGAPGATRRGQSGHEDRAAQPPSRSPPARARLPHRAGVSPARPVRAAFPGTPEPAVLRGAAPGRSGNWAAPCPRLPTATRIERGGGRSCQLGTGIQETRGGGGGISSSPLLLARPEALGLPGTPLARCCRGFPGGQFDSVCGTLSMPADRGSGGRVVWSTPKSHDGTNFVREEYDNGPVL